MDDKREKQELIFHRALELTGKQREFFVARACANEVQQISEINSLLNAFENDAGFLDNPVNDLGLSLFYEEKSTLENTLIGIYQVGNKIGQGGMGEVYDAVDTKLNRRVALKFLTGSSSDDQLARRQLIREAQAIALLDHPNICSIYGIEQIEDFNFIVMPYIEGETLAEFIKNSVFSRERILSLTRQIVSAVAFAHSNGIVHRDLKPANIMIKTDGQIKILDFGLAKIVEKISDFETAVENTDSISRDGLIIGTVSYMSPEQLRGEKLDFQSDIFSVGIILFELMVGKNPFQRESQAETIAALLSEVPPFERDFRNIIPIGLPEIVSKSLQKDKSKRFQSAAEMLVELDNLKATRNVNGISKLGRKSYAMFLVVILILTVLFAGMFFYEKKTPRRSLALVPVTSESDLTEYEYLADGLTRSLTESLSAISSLDVKKETYVSSLKNKQLSLQEVGRKLNVDIVVAGNLTRRPDNFYLNIKILRTADNSILDSSDFLGQESNLVDLQEQVAERVTSIMQFDLTETDRNQMARENSQNPEALELYFKGRYYWSRRKSNDLRTAIEYFTQATDLDPSYAKAWSGLADSYTLYSVPGKSGFISTEEAIIKAKAAAKNALKLNDSLCEPYHSLGMIKLRFEWDWKGAEKDFRMALKLDPEYAPAFSGLSNLYLITGRLDDSLAEAQKLKEFDPFSIHPDLTIGRIYYFKHDYENAARIYTGLQKHIQAIRE